jgi:hypothetical protein
MKMKREKEGEEERRRERERGKHPIFVNEKNPIRLLFRSFSFQCFSPTECDAVLAHMGYAERKRGA